MINFFKKNKELFIFSIILLIAVLTLGIMFYKIDFNKRDKYIDFTTDWVHEGKSADLSKAYKYEYVSKKIPNLKKDAFIYLNVNNIFVDVYIDERLVYSYENYDDRFFEKTPGTYFVKIDLLKEDAGKEIVIDINNVYKDKSGKIKHVYLGEDLDIITSLIWNQLLPFIFSVGILVAGVILISMFIISKKFIDVSVNKFLYLGLFALIVGLFTFADSKVILIVSGNEHFYNSVAGACRTLLTIPLALFVGESYRRISNKKHAYFFAYLGMAHFVICYLLGIFNLLDYHESLFVTHIIYIIDACYLLFLFWKSVWLRSRKEIFHTVGLLFIALGCFIDLVILYYSNSLQSTLCTRIGVFIFLTLEGFKFYLDFLEKFRHKERMDLLKELAYKDGLTELLNRTSFNEELKKLNKCKSGLIAIYDVNDLKKVNDKYGHSEGDKLIMGVAGAFKLHLDEIGKCYRIGGDEFVFISTISDIEKKFLEANEEMLNELKKQDKESKNKFVTSIAMGYSIISKTNSINSAFEKADASMYKNKKKMKKK